MKASFTSILSSVCILLTFFTYQASAVTAMSATSVAHRIKPSTFKNSIKRPEKMKSLKVQTHKAKAKSALTKTSANGLKVPGNSKLKIKTNRKTLSPTALNAKQ